MRTTSFGAPRSAKDTPRITVSAEGNTLIELDGSAAKIAGRRASVRGGKVTITRSGTYRLTGTLSDGQVDVDTGGDVILVLDGVLITNSSGRILIDHTAAKNGGNMVFSSHSLELGETYTVTIGSSSYEMILSGTVTSAGGGSGFQGGFGGGKRPGGNGGKPN